MTTPLAEWCKVAFDRVLFFATGTLDSLKRHVLPFPLAGGVSVGAPCGGVGEAVLKNSALTAAVPHGLHSAFSEGGHGCERDGDGGCFIASDRLDDAVTEAHNRQRLLLVFVHSELHPASVRLLHDLIRSATDGSSAACSASARGASGPRETEGGIAHSYGATATLPPAGSGCGELRGAVLLGVLRSHFVFFATSVLDSSTHRLSRVDGACFPLVVCYASLGGRSGVVEVASIDGPMSILDLQQFVSSCAIKYGGTMLTQLAAAHHSPDAAPS